jgi:hypothetical protein
MRYELSDFEWAAFPNRAVFGETLSATLRRRWAA